MRNRLIFLSVLALMIAGTAFCELSEITKIPASQDVYFGMDKEGVYNTDTLKCEVIVTDSNGSRMSSYSGVPMMQFNISGLKITENDIGILVLKASSIIKQGNESSMIALMPVGSDWSEHSSYLNLVFNLKPIIDIVERNDITKMGVSTDGDKIVAFDVSKKLLDAKANGDRASFLLMAISNSTYSVDFKSRETSEGPYLIVMSYPSEAKGGNAISMPSNESAINQTAANSTAINSAATRSIAINSTTINNTAINQSETNKTAISNTAIIQAAAINQTATNQTAIQPSKSKVKNLNASAILPLNNSTTNKTAIKMEMRNATKNSTENMTKPIAA